MTMQIKQENLANSQTNSCPKAADFNFDLWAELAATDMEKFEEERKKYINCFIQNSPADHQLRLWQLQWKIDAIRKISPNPLSSCLKLYEMLLDQVYGEKGLLDNLMILSGQKTFHEVYETGGGKKGKILPFAK